MSALVLHSPQLTAVVRLRVDLTGVPVLRIVVVIVVDARLLLYYFSLGTAAGHSAAEEDVDEQHDGEEDPEGDAQVGQPRRVNRA